MAAKKPLHLAFKLADGIHVFTFLAGKKVRTDYILEKDSSGETVCGCALYRHESTCEHLVLVTKDTDLSVRSRDSWEATGATIDWKSGAPKSRIAVFDVEKNRIGVVDATLPDVSLAELYEALVHERFPAAAGGILNPNRIYEGCLASVKFGAEISDKQVTDAEAKAAPFDPVAAGVEDSYDDSLAGGPAPVEETEEEAPVAKPEVADDKLSLYERIRKIRRPNPANFFVSKDDWHAMLMALLTGRNVLIVGPSGSGKSELTYIATKAIEYAIEPFNMGAMSEPRTSLIGNTHFSKESGTWFAESRFVRAVQDSGDAGSVVLLDEITRADRGAFNILLPLLDRQGYLALDEAEDAPIIKRGKKVGVVATANIGMEYTGTEAMDAALKKRFSVVIDMWFPPASNEIKILETRCPGLNHADAKRLVDIATTQRRLAREEGEFEEVISTRELLAAGEMIGAGLEFRTACKYAIENLFSADGGDASERTKVKQIVQKGG